MKRKNYLIEDFSKEENIYFKRMVMSARNKFMKKNYNNISNISMPINEEITVDSEYVDDIVIKKIEDNIKSVEEMKKNITNTKLRKSIEALSLKEQTVLFSLFQENKKINQIAKEEEKDRGTIRERRDKALKKIYRDLMEGDKNV